MRLTKRQLRRIIREEKQKLNESYFDFDIHNLDPADIEIADIIAMKIQGSTREREQACANIAVGILEALRDAGHIQ